MPEFKTSNRFSSEPLGGAPPSAENDGKGPDAFKHLGAELAVLRDSLTLYLLARRDQIACIARRALIGSLLGICGLLVLAALLISATVHLVTGIALGLGEALGGRVWLGDVLTGSIILLFVAVMVRSASGGWMSAARTRTIERHAKRKLELAERRAAARRANVGK